MDLKRCSQAHYYDASQHTSCPHCGIADLQMEPTTPKRATVPENVEGPTDYVDVTKPARPAAPEADASNRGSTRRRGQVWERGSDDRKTIGIFQKEKGVNPVVGWLVCVEGKDWGRDYRIRSGRNFIGRSEKMDIWIKGDDSISREKHAMISYDPKNGRFKLLPGDSTGLTYLNDDTVDMPTELKPFDTIELGATKLKFVPFCGEEFRWGIDPEGAAGNTAST